MSRDSNLILAHSSACLVRNEKDKNVHIPNKNLCFDNKIPFSTCWRTFVFFPQEVVFVDMFCLWSVLTRKLICFFGFAKMSLY